MTSFGGDKFKKVQSGDPLAIRSDTFNSFIDAARAYSEVPRSSMSDTPSNRQHGSILVGNTTSGTVGRSGILGLYIPFVTPGSDSWFMGTMMGASAPGADHAINGNIAVMLEPVGTFKFGRAVISGNAVVRINVTDAAHYAATAIAGNTTNLVSAAAGPIKVIWKESGVGLKWAIVVLSSFTIGAVPDPQVDYALVWDSATQTLTWRETTECPA